MGATETLTWVVEKLNAPEIVNTANLMIQLFVNRAGVLL